MELEAMKARPVKFDEDADDKDPVVVMTVKEAGDTLVKWKRNLQENQAKSSVSFTSTSG